MLRAAQRYASVKRRLQFTFHSFLIYGLHFRGPSVSEIMGPRAPTGVLFVSLEQGERGLDGAVDQKQDALSHKQDAYEVTRRLAQFTQEHRDEDDA